MLPGREREGAFLNDLLSQVRGGQSAAVVVRGEAGVGKTALLNDVFGSAMDLRLARSAGIDSEMELPYAGLQQLCQSMLDHLRGLPPPQSDALRTAFGLIEGPAPDRFLVGLAVLGLLSEAAERRPLVCVIDDCQWLDRASSQALLQLVVRWRLDEQVREQILAETQGNPLALLELPRGRSPAELAGGFGLPAKLSLSGRIEESFLRRVKALPEATWLMVLIAAAEPAGNPALVWRAASRLGLPGDAMASAEAEGLLTINGHVVFRHPLVRSAIYGTSSLSDRRKVHAALAGAPDAARQLLSTAEAGPLGELERAQVDMIRAQIAYSTNRGSDAPALLLRAARRLEPLGLRLARQTYLDAELAAHFAGRLAPGSLRDAADAARRVPAAAGPRLASDHLLDGLAIAVTDGYPAGAPALKQAVREFPAATAEEQLRWLWPAAHVAMGLWDDESYEILSARHIEIGREAGVLAVLPTALTTRIVAYAFTGQLTAAEELIGELRVLADAIGIPVPPYGPVFVSAWRGRDDEASAVIEAAVEQGTASGEGAVLAFADYARAVLGNASGHYDAALAAAAARAGKPEHAAGALAQLAEMTRASGTDWAAGIWSRSQALLSADHVAESRYREAIERLGRTRVRPQLARAHLVYGEWLRRQSRRVDARRELLQAFGMFTAMGLEAFPERARRELAATGEKVRRQAVARQHDLTDQETQIAKLAREGLTNQEIAFQLYLSARTVEWHLRKVFTKLGITSRRELQTAVL